MKLEQCPYIQKLRAGDESIDMCEINSKYCLLESSLSCDTYQEYLLETAEEKNKEKMNSHIE